MKKAMATIAAVVLTLLKNKVTYRFLGVLLVAFGVTHGEEIATAVQTVACAFLGGCL